MNSIEKFVDSLVSFLPLRLQQITRNYKQVWTYAFIGVLGLWVDLGIFYLLFNFGDVDKGVANLISSVVAIFHNFVLNILFNFKKRDRVLMRLLSFYAIGIVGIGITQVMFWIFTDWIGITANIIKPISIIVVFVIQYNLNKRISFR